MSAYSEAKKLYGEGELDAVIVHCAGIGLVHIEEDCLLCAYPTRSDYIEIKSKKGVDKVDTWYVYVASGNLSKLLQLDNKGMKYIAYRRFDKRFRLVELSKLIRRASNG